MIEYRVYYDADGKIITYTVENIPGNYIVVSAEQYAESRYDARVAAGKLVYMHEIREKWKLTKVLAGGVSASRWDINIITNSDAQLWSYTPHKIY